MKIVKYFFEFISVISLFCIFKIIGLRNASNIGSLIGKFIGPFFRSKNVIKKNIKIGLGNIGAVKEKEIINSMWSNIGRTFAEYMFLKDFKFNKTNFNHISIIGSGSDLTTIRGGFLVENNTGILFQGLNVTSPNGMGLYISGKLLLQFNILICPSHDLTLFFV